MGVELKFSLRIQTFPDPNPSPFPMQTPNPSLNATQKDPPLATILIIEQRAYLKELS